MTKILNAIPYTDDRLFDQTIDCILSLDVPDNVFIDNLFLRGNGNDLQYTDRRERITVKRNEARSIAISGGYDYINFIDSDVVFKPDSLLKLYHTMTKYSPDIVYGLYAVRKEPYWLCCTLDVEYNKDTNEAIHYALSSNIDVARQMMNCEGLYTKGIGFGMTLINIEVLHKIQFRYVPENRQYEDFWFSYDCKQAGFQSMHNMQVKLGHILTDSKNVVFPYDNEDLYVIRELK